MRLVLSTVLLCSCYETKITDDVSMRLSRIEDRLDALACAPATECPPCQCSNECDVKCDEAEMASSLERLEGCIQNVLDKPMEYSREEALKWCIETRILLYCKGEPRTPP